jgi:hypothetical protein
MTGLWIAVVVLALAVVFLALVLAAAVRRMDALRAEVAAMTERLDPADGAGGGLVHPPSGLPVGAAAPVVEGERVEGGRWSSSAWAGRRHVVAFADPGCLACEDLVPALLAAAAAGDVPGTVVVGAAAPGAWPATWRSPSGADDRIVVLDDDDGAVAAAFDSGFTPHVFVVDEGGAVTAQGPADTLDAVRTLVRESEGIRIVRPGASGA